jgi:hypothetical protein
MKKLFLTIISGLIIYQATAQRFDYSQDYNFFRKYHFWGISISANNYPFNRHDEPVTGALVNRWHLMWGISAGINFHWRWNNYLGMKFKPRVEWIPIYSYRLYIPPEQTGDGKAYYDNTGNKYAPLSFHLPVGFEARTFLVDRYTFYLQGGLDLGYRTALTTSFSYNRYLDISLQIGQGFFWAPYISVGWYYEFPWVLWETSFVYRFGLQPAYTGNYFIHHLNTISPFSGRIEQPGGYIGLEFTWYLKKSFIGDDAACPGQVHSRKVLKRRRMEERAREKARKNEEKMRKKEIKRNRKIQRKVKRNKR